MIYLMLTVLYYLGSKNEIIPDTRKRPWNILSKIYPNLNNTIGDYYIKIKNNKQNIKLKLNEKASTSGEASGTGVKFLSSDPKVLINKLNISLAEKKAGNNYVFDEISAISDELRRSGVLTL